MQVEFKRVTLTGQKHLSPFRTARLEMPQSEKVILSTVGLFVAFVGLVGFCSMWAGLDGEEMSPVCLVEYSLCFFWTLQHKVVSINERRQPIDNAYDIILSRTVRREALDRTTNNERGGECEQKQVTIFSISISDWRELFLKTFWQASLQGQKRPMRTRVASVQLQQ